MFGNEGERYTGNPSNKMVQRIDQTQEAYGALVEAEYPLLGGTLLAGWWYQSLESTPPPKMTKMFAIKPNGSLEYKSIAMLNDIDQRVSSSPYLSYDVAFDQTHLYAGMQVDASDEAVVLPSLIVERYLSSALILGGGYSRNFANPWQGPLWSVYNSNTAKFTAAGISLQDLWDELKLETSDNVELFVRYADDTVGAKVGLFYGAYDHKQVTVYDPALELSYYKSNASATSMGAEAELNLILSKALGMFASGYYNRFAFDEDILLSSDRYLASKGKQIPDVARVGAKVGLTFKAQGWRLSPMLRYVGERFGDAENKETIHPYAVVDLTGAYVIDPQHAEVTLAVQNLANQKYVGVVANSLDDTRPGSTNYYQGAPFSVVASLNLHY